MKRSIVKSKIFLIILLVVSFLASYTINASSTTLEDPLQKTPYAHEGAGTSFNYKDKLSARVEYIVILEDGMSVTGNSDSAHPEAIAVRPGQVVNMNFTVSHVAGCGDGADGIYSICDLLFIVANNNNGIIGSNPEVDTEKIDETHLAYGEDLQLNSISYTIPVEAAGTIISLPYALFDYGLFEVNYFSDWMSAKTVDGFINFSVATITVEQPTTPVQQPVQEPTTPTEQPTTEQPITTVQPITQEQPEQPVQLEEIEIIEPVIPEALIAVLSEVSQEDKELIITNEKLPEIISNTTLPQTGGIPANVFYLMGGSLAVVGLIINRKQIK